MAKKEEELNAVEIFGALFVACAASAAAVGLVLRKLSDKKPVFYGYQTSREEINELFK
jgi:hypothetical protein